MNATLLEPLTRRLRQLSRVIRAARLLRTIAGFVIVLGGGLAMAFAADRAFGLSVPALRALNVSLAAVGGAGMLTIVVRWFGRAPSDARLARLVETRFPGFDERLLSVATLPRDTAASPLIEALDRETTDRAAGIDFRQAFSWQSTRRLVRCAAALVFVIGLVAALWPDASRFVRRVTFAWSPAVYGFELHVSPAGGYSALGQPLLLAAELIPLESTQKLPDHCVAVIQRDAGPPHRVPMDAVAPGRFAVAVAEMPARLRFAIEAGERVSEPIDIVGAPAVRLASPPQIEIAPPPYAALPVERFDGAVPFRVLQFSTASFRFAFDRKPADARLSWKDREIPLTLADDGLSAHAQLVTAEPGSFTGELRLVAEHGIVSTSPVAGGVVWADPPPVFSSVPRVNGKAMSSATLSVHPEEILRIEATLDDAVGLGSLDLEYRVNASPVQRETVAALEGKRHFDGDWIVLLRGKVKAGDRLDLRLRGVDNRRLARGQIRSNGDDRIPAETLTPLEVVDPAGKDEWYSFNIDSSAAPLAKQPSGAEALSLKEVALAQEIANAANASPEDLARWKKEQDAIARAFDKWAADEPKIKELDAARQKQTAEQLARKAVELAARQRDLTDKAAQELDERLKSALAEVAAKQAKLAGEVARLQRDLHLGLDAPDLPVPALAAKSAGRDLAAGKVEPGLADQQKTVAGLEQLRDKLAALVLGDDPKKLAAKLADAQQKLIVDLEKLAEEFPRIPENETIQRMQDLHQRQKALHKAIGQLPVPAKEKQAEATRREASAAAEEAVEGIRKKDLIPARDAMEKSRDALRKLNGELPTTPDADARDREKQQEKSRLALQSTAAALAQEQKRVHDETRKIVADAMKNDAARNALAQAVDGLKNDAMKLSQEMADPAGKTMAKESADDIDEASQALQSAQAKRGAGNLDMADKNEQSAGLKLQSAGQRLGKFAAGMPKPGPSESQLAEAFGDAQDLLKKASANGQPAPATMKKAAQAMRKTSQIVGAQNPASTAGVGTRPEAGTSNILPLTAAIGDAWGDLPGEVRTRLTQEWRARYGADYEEIIQRYFRNLSRTPTKK